MGFSGPYWPTYLRRETGRFSAVQQQLKWVRPCCELCWWDSEETKNPAGLNMSSDVGFWVRHINSASQKSFVLPRSQLWFPVALPDIFTPDKLREHDTKMKIRDAGIRLNSAFFPSPSMSTLKTQARAAGRGQSDSPAAPLPAAVLCQFNGIPAMSALTGGLGKPTKGFGALLEESRESRRCRSGEKRRWNKNSKSWRCSRCGWLVFKEDEQRLSGAFSA